MKVTHGQGDPRSLTLLEDNARHMRHETYQRLVETLRRDGVLIQWPFVWHDAENGRRVVLAGNHRVQASIDAGLTEIDWTECDERLDPDRRLSYQLGTNAIVGEDDPTILKRLYESIEDVEERLAAGLDDATLELLKRVDTDALSEVNLTFSTLLMTFLPAEYEEALVALDQARQAAGANNVWLLRHEQHEQVLAAIEDARQAAHVMNTATAFDVLLALWAEHREDFLTRWWDPETGEQRGGAKDEVPVTSLTGLMMPAAAAAKVARAVARMKSSGQITESWQVLEVWADAHLSSKEKK